MAAMSEMKHAKAAAKELRARIGARLQEDPDVSSPALYEEMEPVRRELGIDHTLHAFRHHVCRARRELGLPGRPGRPPSTYSPPEPMPRPETDLEIERANARARAAERDVDAYARVVMRKVGLNGDADAIREVARMWWPEATEKELEERVKLVQELQGRERASHRRYTPEEVEDFIREGLGLGPRLAQPRRNRDPEAKRTTTEGGS